MTAKTTRKKTTKKKAARKSTKKSAATTARCSAETCDRDFVAAPCPECEGKGCEACQGAGIVNPATDTTRCIDCSGPTEGLSAEDTGAMPTAMPAPADAKPQRKAAPRRRGRSKRLELTMAALTGAYLAHLEASGKSSTTVFSYGIDAKLALKHFGAETAVATITPEDIAAFNDSDAVTKTRTGRAKAKPTIDKTRRVLRLMLTWAAEVGEIKSAPIPAKEGK